MWLVVGCIAKWLPVLSPILTGEQIKKSAKGYIRDRTHPFPSGLRVPKASGQLNNHHRLHGLSSTCVKPRQ